MLRHDILACSIIASVLVGAVPFRAAEAASPASQVTPSNAVALTITNYGFLGNNFINRTSSFEYPAGSGFEHMVRGGLWIGAQAVGAQPFVGVTSACLDGPLGTSPVGASEFTPALAIQRRSIAPSSPYYDPQAISENDLVSEFDDLTPLRAQGNPESHRPLGLLVRQEVYGWSSPELRDVAFMRYVIRSPGAALENLWVGINAELASGDKNAYGSWPPSSASGGAKGGWFEKAWLEYDDSHRLLREHYCRGLPLPGGCDLAHVPHWAGIQLLTPPDAARGQHVTLAGWGYAPSDPARDTDLERYALMSAGAIQDFTAPALAPATGDPVELLAIGPFARLEAGDSIVVDFAVLGGAEVDDVREHARVAQLWRDQGFQGELTPVLASGSAEAEAGRVRLRWHTSEPVAAATVQRTSDGSSWSPIGECSRAGDDVLSFEDAEAEAGARYGYRLALDLADGEATVGETWVQVPARPRFALEGVRPQPARAGEASVAFTLDRAGPVVLQVMDLGGRRVETLDLGTLEPGAHRATLGAAAKALPSGAYFFRLVQGTRTAVTRGVLLR